jgi:hypothetical protein
MIGMRLFRKHRLRTEASLKKDGKLGSREKADSGSWSERTFFQEVGDFLLAELADVGNVAIVP